MNGVFTEKKKSYLRKCHSSIYYRKRFVYIPPYFCKNNGIFAKKKRKGTVKKLPKKSHNSVKNNRQISEETCRLSKFIQDTGFILKELFVAIQKHIV